MRGDQVGSVSGSCGDENADLLGRSGCGSIALHAYDGIDKCQTGLEMLVYIHKHVRKIVHVGV